GLPRRRPPGPRADPRAEAQELLHAPRRDDRRDVPHRRHLGGRGDEQVHGGGLRREADRGEHLRRAAHREHPDGERHERDVARVAAAPAHLRDRRPDHPRRPPRRHAHGDPERGLHLRHVAVRPPPPGAGGGHRRRVLQHQALHPHERARVQPPGGAGRHEGRRHRDRGRRALLPRPRPAGPRAEDRGAPVHGGGGHREAGQRVRLLPRPAGDRPLPLAAQPRHQPARRRRRPHRAGRDARPARRAHGGGARDDARAAAALPVAARQLPVRDVRLGPLVLRRHQGEDGGLRHRAPRDRPPRRRDGHHEHHARGRRGAHARDRGAQGARRAPPRHHAPVPRRGGHALGGRRGARDRARDRRREAALPGLPLPSGPRRALVDRRGAAARRGRRGAVRRLPREPGRPARPDRRPPPGV
ncbi:MAG: ABC-type antimicrobial peptide transport system, permease component, partial [uncultured Gemmatimonadaceae bacterium]